MRRIGAPAAPHSLLAGDVLPGPRSRWPGHVLRSETRHRQTLPRPFARDTASKPAAGPGAQQRGPRCAAPARWPRPRPPKAAPAAGRYRLAAARTQRIRAGPSGEGQGWLFPRPPPGEPAFSPAADLHGRTVESWPPVGRFLGREGLFGFVARYRRTSRRPDRSSIVLRASNGTAHGDRASFGRIGKPDHRIRLAPSRWSGGCDFGRLFPCGEARRARTLPRAEPARRPAQRRGREGRGGQHPKDQAEVVDPFLTLHGDQLGGAEALSEHRDLRPEEVHLAGRNGILGRPAKVRVEADPLEVFHGDAPHPVLVLEGPGEVTGLTVVADGSPIDVAGAGSLGDGEGHS